MNRRGFFAMFAAGFVARRAARCAAEFIETRRFQKGEIARLFRVPLGMLGELDRATNKNSEREASALEHGQFLSYLRGECDPLVIENWVSS